MKKRLLFCSVALMFSSVIGYADCEIVHPDVKPAREVISLNPSWRFHQGDDPAAAKADFDDSGWTEVNLPHSWNESKPSKGGSIYWPGVSWYRRSVEWDASKEKKSVFLEFDGAGETTDVFVNGQQLGRHRSPYGRFRFDITGMLFPGTNNVVAVRVDNRHSDEVVGLEPRRMGWAPYGGIYREVSLILTNQVHIDVMDSGSSGLYVTPSKVTAGSAVVQVVAKLANDLTEEKAISVKVTILDAEGRHISEMASSQTLSAKGRESVRMITRLEKPHLWNGVADPYLYSARVEVKDMDGATLDLQEVSFGIRSYRFDPDEGFFLNGKSYPLKGVSLHQERKNTGWALTPAMLEEDVSIIREMGGNAVRSHYQMSDTFYDICARTGLLVWAEIPFWQYQSVSKPLMDNAKLQLRELVLQNYNNPSLLIWSVGNECYVKYTEIRAAIAEMHDYIHSLDRTRVTSYANPRNFGDIPQLVSELTDVASYNWYCGWYIDTDRSEGPGAGLGELADSYHEYYPDQSIGISEYGASGCIEQHEQNPKLPNPTGMWFPEEYQTYLHETYWKQVAERPFIYGVFIWCMFDFGVPGWSRGAAPHMNWKGMVTQDRKVRKDIFYFYQANWSDEPFVYITSRRHMERTEVQTPVKVYSNCAKVSLTVNGRLQDTVPSEHGVFKWSNISLQAGRNIIRVVAEKEGQQYHDECRWKYIAKD